MNSTIIYAHLMLLTLLALFSSGCTRGLNESPIEFEEKSTRHTENMTPEEWEAFKNKAIESIIHKYTGQSTPTSGQVRVVELDSPAHLKPMAIEEKVDRSEPHCEEKPNTYSSNKLHIPETLEPSTLPGKKAPPAKSEEKTFEKVDRYSQLKIKPEETKGKQYRIPPNAVQQSSSTAGALTSGSNSYVWPVKGSISKGYGKSDKGTNNGINIKAKAGAHVVAVEKGKVIFVGSIKGMGKVILIEHPNQMIAAYAQVANISVRANDVIEKNQKIASVLAIDGQDGELHFELRKGTQTLNPMEYLK
jgi:murein DD-endopeptidase MepM/ murein hydrolase activator NlpD